MKFPLSLFKKKIKLQEDGDILEFPRQPGLMIFPISMAKIQGEQSPKKIFDFIVEKVLQKMWKGDPISVLIIYSTSFYERYNVNLGKDMGQLAKEHEVELKKLIAGVSYLEKSAYSYMDWDEFINKYIDRKKLFEARDHLYKLSLEDEKFGSYLLSDIARLKKQDTDDGRLFILEEAVLFYMILKEYHFTFKDDFTKNMNRWIILCYSGFALKVFAYLHQKNYFNVTSSNNLFQDTFYDFKSNYLYKYQELDIDRYNSLESYATQAKEVLHR
ncbi:MAG: hypothetical protein VX028_02645 [Nanoarchaeota archaeon]|nr:hypothetical protein [Nanoarchaeota archaeon]